MNGMKKVKMAAAVLAATVLTLPPASADPARGHGMPPGIGRAGPVPVHGAPIPVRGGGYGHGHGGYAHGHGGHFWGPFGLLLGSAIVYSALQPRTVYYEPQVVYTPPVYYYPPTYYASTVVTPTYVWPGDQVVGPTYIVQTPAPLPPPASVTLGSNVQAGPGASGESWWYVCKNPPGYYPHVQVCASGWEKVPPVSGAGAPPEPSRR